MGAEDRMNRGGGAPREARTGWGVAGVCRAGTTSRLEVQWGKHARPTLMWGQTPHPCPGSQHGRVSAGGLRSEMGRDRLARGLRGGTT